MSELGQTASWRDGASPQAQSDLDELLSAALGAALEHLDKNGEFYPFAMTVEGSLDERTEHPDVDLVFADPAAFGEQPEVADVLEELRRVLKVRAENANRTIPQRACAIVLEVIVPEFGECVRVDLEHSEEIQLMVVAPVKSSGKARKRRHDYGQLRLMPGQRHIW